MNLELGLFGIFGLFFIGEILIYVVKMKLLFGNFVDEKIKRLVFL